MRVNAHSRTISTGTNCRAGKGLPASVQQNNTLAASKSGAEQPI